MTGPWFAPRKTHLIWHLASHLRKALVFTVLILSPTVVAAAAATGACQESLSGRRITLVVPYAPGGGWDSYARTFAAVFEDQTGARVFIRNVSGAGGMLGIRAIAEARPASLTLGLFNPAALIVSRRTGVVAPSLDAFLMLGALVTDSLTMAGQDGFSVFSEYSEPLVIGAIDTELAGTFLAMQALNWDVRPILGYSGSAERFLALLRGDIDLIVGTSDSIANSLRSASQGVPLLSFTDSPTASFPQLAYLAGTGGVVDRLTQNLPAEQRNARLALAQLAADISRKPRAITISSRVEGMPGECLRDSVEQTLFSAELQERATVAGLELAPRSAASVNALLVEIAELVRSNEQSIEQVLTDNLGGR